MSAAGPDPVRGGVLLGAFAACVLTAVAAAAADGDAPLRDRLAAASPERGREVFRVCSACHTIDAGAAYTIGPSLRGVVGRPVGSAEGYDRYSPAMASYGGVWTPERLDRYLGNPMGEIEGTAMVFPGVPNAADRADVIAWLGRDSPSLSRFTPTRNTSGGMADEDHMAEADAAGRATRGSARLPDLGVLVAGEGAWETHAYCSVCHSERIVAQQGLTRADWEELLEQMVEEHGMSPVEEPDLGRVLGYLTANYGPDRPNFSRH